ncbi:MAG: hypothetical protein Q4E03_01465 [Trueperella sp.]|nr:hypothetical protein [Trueperella sp.]
MAEDLNDVSYLELDFPPEGDGLADRVMKFVYPKIPDLPTRNMVMTSYYEGYDENAILLALTWLERNNVELPEVLLEEVREYLEQNEENIDIMAGLKCFD